MIKIVKTDRGNRSILLEISNLTAEQHFEVGNALCRGDSDSYDCGPFTMVCCGEFVDFDDMVDAVEALQKKFVRADISYETKPVGDGVATIRFTDVEVPLCEDDQVYFYDRPTAKFHASIFTEPVVGGTSFTMDSIDDYGWSSHSDKILDPEKVKALMIGYLDQIPETGASEENWKDYFCETLGFTFEVI